MSKINSFESSSLALFFNNVSLPGIGDAVGIVSSSSSGSFWVSLHTADPGETGTQSTSEAAYTGYTRTAVSRSVEGWTVSGSTVYNSSSVTFPAPTAGSSVITYWGIGTGSAGAGRLLYKGPISAAPIGFAIGDSSQDTFTIKNHGLGVSDRVAIFQSAGLSLPGNVTEGTVYYVKTTPSTDSITVSTTDGGSTLDITSDGQGLAYKVNPYTTSIGIQPQFLAGALKILED